MFLFRSSVYLHMGLVQVGIKPLIKGLNTSVLRVYRNLNYEQSIHSTVETSLCSGPIHFSYPNFSVSLQDINILKTLTLQIKTRNSNIAGGSIPLALAYMVYYKTMLSAFGRKAFKHSPRGETLSL